ncbi:class I SAM-dependent methyltransferase [Desulfobacter hydrogenophilus]|uniref:Class I SAM-dependent methyltransferase n=1 Tax=Desulfobacter hydrogenophilus TaxID=2291 RepID=A0A328FEF9_9BACT|nr:class I SAM-dependent methyltransferase [Desulfobacter hydrogenophilus]NDY71000.1 class I SAM-dependent methyltransferase [Desulfobacter hydrogenophilus]QBH12761.1 class I SAM-dependent methyltransferase [Desulfobacter hydrogenophilus]RAM02998.1 class I SAM-dependent methyltransferase [Desulfobacter hydrogenophilus]
MDTPGAFTAKIYDPILYFALKNIRQDIIRLIPDYDARILDLCCGTGDQLKRLADAGFSNLTGVDVSPDMLKVAGKGNKIATLLTCDVQHTGLPGANFDIIIISLAVHEKPAHVQNNMLAEAKRLLAPGGQLILVDFSLDDQAKMTSRIAATMIERLAGKTHYRHFKAYVNNGGMPPVIQEFFKIKQQIRHARGVISIWMVTGKERR